MSEKSASLKFENLTVRFGGLTAVEDFSFEVPERTICSIIGPNGAGKTTAFNVATGIYEPTAGRVLICGVEPIRPLSWRVWLACMVLGLITGISLFLLTHDIDKIWKAAVKRNMGDKSTPFTYGEAFADAWAYLRGDLAVEPARRGRWSVVSDENRRILGNFPTKEAAEEQRNRLMKLLVAADQGAQPRQKEGRWVIVSRDGAEVASFATKTEADDELETFRDINSQRKLRHLLAYLFGSLGLLFGFAGTYAVWSQSRRTPDVITRGGIARTFQNIRLFRDMTVLENVLVGMERRLPSGPIRMMLRTPGVRKSERRAAERAMELLHWVRLADSCNVLAKNLPYGAQRRLEIARALATKPHILLLDEPAAGMNPTEADELKKLIRQIKEEGITILLIEHHMRVVMDISDRIAVLDQGHKIAEGTPREVRENPKVIEAYLGSEELG